MKPKFIHKMGPFFGLFLFAIALVILYHELRVYHLHDFLGNIKNIPTYRLFLALLLTIMSYLIMTGYDALALLYVYHPLPYGKVALASFISYAFSNNMGFGMIAGGSVGSVWGWHPYPALKAMSFPRFGTDSELLFSVIVNIFTTSKVCGSIRRSLIRSGSQSTLRLQEVSLFPASSRISLP